VIMPSPVCQPGASAASRPSIGLCLCLIPLIPAAGHSAADPFRELLDAEATKVETDVTDTGGSDAAMASPLSARQAEVAASREQFEALLRRDNLGTHSFCRKERRRCGRENARSLGAGRCDRQNRSLGFLGGRGSGLLAQRSGLRAVTAGCTGSAGDGVFERSYQVLSRRYADVATVGTNHGCTDTVMESANKQGLDSD
jgi:hypothetical protein